MREVQDSNRRKQKEPDTYITDIYATAYLVSVVAAAAAAGAGEAGAGAAAAGEPGAAALVLGTSVRATFTTSSRLSTDFLSMAARAFCWSSWLLNSTKPNPLLLNNVLENIINH
jgi:hypothetical protein